MRYLVTRYTQHWVLTQFAQCWNQHRVHRISYCRIHNRIQSALLLFKLQLNAVSNSIIEVLSWDSGNPWFSSLWRLLNLSFPIAFLCWSTHDGSNVEWFKILRTGLHNMWPSEQSERLNVHRCRRVTWSPPPQTRCLLKKFAVWHWNGPFMVPWKH